MTKNEAFSSIDRLGSDAVPPIDLTHIEDAKRLIEILPERALRALREVWLRAEPIEGNQIEFFWSRSADIMNAGNRITRFQTLGNGQFDVLIGDPSRIRWQRSPDGYPIPDVLALDSDGSQALIEQIVEWQVS